MINSLGKLRLVQGVFTQLRIVDVVSYFFSSRSPLGDFLSQFRIHS